MFAAIYLAIRWPPRWTVTAFSLALLALASDCLPGRSAQVVHAATPTGRPTRAGSHDTVSPQVAPVGDWPALLPSGQYTGSQLPDNLQTLATVMLRENLPDTYSDTRHWGKTKERWNGIDTRLDGLQLRTHSKRKRVNHGTWKRYQITPLDPAQHLQVTLGEIRTAPDGRASFQVTLAAKINAVAQIAQWNRGVRLASISMDADAHVQITANCLLGVQLDPSRLPPDVILAPEIVDADLRLSGFHVNRVSHLEGPLARELSGTLQSLINKQLDDKRPQLVAKLNRQILKHKDDLRLSLRDIVRDRWNAFSAQPATINAGQ